MQHQVGPQVSKKERHDDNNNNPDHYARSWWYLTIETASFSRMYLMSLYRWSSSKDIWFHSPDNFFPSSVWSREGFKRSADNLTGNLSWRGISDSSWFSFRYFLSCLLYFRFDLFRRRIRRRVVFYLLCVSYCSERVRMKSGSGYFSQNLCIWAFDQRRFS